MAEVEQNAGYESLNFLIDESIFIAHAASKSVGQTLSVIRGHYSKEPVQITSITRALVLDQKCGGMSPHIVVDLLGKL